jgi:membrane associated rhomboid family serine protease
MHSMFMAGSGKSKATVTNALIALCVLIFLITLFGSEEFALSLLYGYGLIPSAVGVASPLTLVTYMFLHASLAHLASNIFVLYTVGREVERDVGSLRLGLIYLASGVSAGIIHMAVNPTSDTPVMGASGAIFGLIAVMMLLMPFKVTTALFLPLPGVVMGLFLVLVEIASVLVSVESGVAHDMHLYGFFVGCIGAFAIDYDRAFRGLIIALLILLGLYVWAVYLEGVLIVG